MNLILKCGNMQDKNVKVVDQDDNDKVLASSPDYMAALEYIARIETQEVVNNPKTQMKGAQYIDVEGLKAIFNI